VTNDLSTSIRGRVETLAVILGDQLDPENPALADLDAQTDAVLMMEVAEESTHVASHRQRTAMFLAAMRHFAADLQARGTRVRYVKLDARGNTQSLDDEVSRAVRTLEPARIAVTEPGEWRIADSAERWREVTRTPVDVLPDPHFTATHDMFETWARGRKELVMEYFYREQRRRLDVLVDGKKPVGGKWNFDADNRARFPSAPNARTPYRPRPDDVTVGVMETVTRRLSHLPGAIDTLPWPVTRRQAKRALDDFVEHRLPHFGTYQDAMWTGEPWLYHSTLGAALNLKLLAVRTCVDAAVEAHRSGHAPLNAVEGFVRQIIGWREFIRGVYWREGASYRTRNALEHHGDLPEFYWTGETEMVCLSESIGQVLEFGYGHHIQRLMVTGNFALIAGIEPQQVNDWYLGMYVDAVDWVTTPNVIGMALHADGGVVGTKPYAASGRYISRMSNYCANCRFDPGQRVGDDACPFTTFYWDFLIRHRRRFENNHRMRMILANVDRMEASEQREIRKRADTLRAQFAI
jgi:deoxyribodipyrimidine photolyase-related protein